MTHLGTFVGLATLDIVHRVRAPVGPDEKVTALRQDMQAGGPAANAAITFAALGGRARLVTALGGNPPARAAADDLVAHGVDVRDATPRASGPPPVSSVRVVDGTGERSVSSVNDAAALDASLDAVEVDGVLVLDGWYAGLALPAAHAARQLGLPIVLGAGGWRPLVAQLLPLADYVIVPATFPRDRIPAQKLSAHTDGARPVTWRAGDRSGEVAVPAVTARDTLAAGDVFLGAAAHAIASGVTDWPDVLRSATQVASRFVAEVGRAGR